MLPIYICEDDERIRDAERRWLEKQILIEGFDMEIVLCTGNPEELLDCLAYGQQQGIYFPNFLPKKKAVHRGSFQFYIQKINALLLPIRQTV